MKILNPFQYEDFIINDFKERLQIQKSKFVQGDKIQYSLPDSLITARFKEQPKPTVWISSEAYVKMRFLVEMMKFKESGWFMIVENVSAEKNSGNEEAVDEHYRINEIFVYEQEVSGVTTTMINDFEFFNSLSLAQRTALRGQGHSHVDMGVTPSAVDTNFYSEYCNNFDGGVLIFLIMNKKNEINVMIYDKDKNIIFENADINIFVEGADSENINNWAEEEIKKVKTKAVVVTGTPKTYGGIYSGTSHSYNGCDNARDYFYSSYDSRDYSGLKKDDKKKRKIRKKNLLPKEKKKTKQKKTGQKEKWLLWE